MSLPAELEREFWQQISQIEEEKRMRYVTTVERRAIEQGIEQGMEREAIALTMRLLRRRFGAIAEGMEARIRRLPIARIEDLSEALFDLESEADLLRWLEEAEG